MDSGVPFEFIEADEFDALELAIAAAERVSASSRKKTKFSTSSPSLHAPSPGTDSAPCVRATTNECGSLSAQSNIHLNHSQNEVSIEAARESQVSDDSLAAADEERETFEEDQGIGYADCEDRPCFGVTGRSEKERSAGRFLENKAREEKEAYQAGPNRARESDRVLDANGAGQCGDTVEKLLKSTCCCSSEYSHTAEGGTPLLHKGTSQDHFTSRRLPSWKSCADPHLLESSSQPLLTTAVQNLHTADEEPQITRPLDFHTDQCTNHDVLPWGFMPSKHRVMPKQKLPSFQFKGQIIYSVTVPDAQSAAQDLLKCLEAKKGALGEAIPLGFDTEWKVIFKRGAEQRKVAVVQLCVDACHCNIFHTIHSGIPYPLRAILEDPLISKVGVGAYGDAAKLFTHYNVKVKGIKDLNVLANLKLAVTAKRSWSLASLIEELLGKQVDKNSSIRMGDWEVEALSDQQLQYAATDAFASLYLYQVLSTFPDPQREASSAHGRNA